MDHVARYSEARQITLIGAVSNLILSAIKIAFGLLGQSHALVADGVHSLSDLLSDALVLFASRFGSQGADSDHPYGHARIETAATVAVAMLLIFAGIGIIYDAGIHLFYPKTLQKPDLFVLWVAIFSLLINEILYHYTLRVAKRIKSELMRAHAWHRRSDAASSLVVLIGVGLALLGFASLDVIAAIIVGMMIIKMGWDLAWSSVRELVDTGLDEQTLEQIRDIITHVPGVKTIHQLRTRTMGQSILVDVHILVEPYLSVSEGHFIGQQVHLILMQKVPAVTDVTVHIDPEDDEFAPTSHELPSREMLLQQLQQQWHNLPGANHIDMITTHYLAGKIHLDIGLPLTLVTNPTTAEQLTLQYQQAIANIREIATVRVWFR